MPQGGRCRDLLFGCYFKNYETKTKFKLTCCHLLAPNIASQDYQIFVDSFAPYFSTEVLILFYCWSSHLDYEMALTWCPIFTTWDSWTELHSWIVERLATDRFN